MTQSLVKSCGLSDNIKSIHGGPSGRTELIFIQGLLIYLIIQEMTGRQESL